MIIGYLRIVTAIALREIKIKTKKIDKPSEKDFNNPYEFGFETEIDTVFAPKGLNEDVIRFISDKKEEPKWLLDWN